MISLPLHAVAGHLFVTIEGREYLIDTGAPTSFGDHAEVTISGGRFPLASSFVGLDAGALSASVGKPVAGLLGADVLNVYDIRFCPAEGKIELSRGEISASGIVVPLEFYMGIPILVADVAGESLRMFFDTGAQVSYLQNTSLADFPAAGKMQDFYPGFGTFETETYRIRLGLAGATFTVRAGKLPSLLGMSLMMAGTTGIVGNELLKDRITCYLPRRKMLVLC